MASVLEMCQHTKIKLKKQETTNLGFLKIGRDQLSAMRQNTFVV